MKITIHRGTKEIGGTLLEVKSVYNRVLIDAGYPLFLNGKPIDFDLSKLNQEELIDLGIIPNIEGLYQWEKADFDAVIISHSHLDHYGLLKYINKEIPIYASIGTRAIINISQIFKIVDNYDINYREFEMYKPFKIGDIEIMPYLMDHSAFDAAAFEIKADGKAIIYTGDLRAHGRKAICLDRFINNASKADALLIEGSMFGRQDEDTLTEQALEDKMYDAYNEFNYPILFQCSSQNIDRLVSFYRLSQRLKRLFIIDVYTANVLYELRRLGNNKLPYASKYFPNIRVFYPYNLTQKVFKQIGSEYATKFRQYHISREEINEKQSQIIMVARPSIIKDIDRCNLKDGVLIYSMWKGYRDSEYQQSFEKQLKSKGLTIESYHTSGHSTVKDIKRLIDGLNPKVVIPIHTMSPEAFLNLSNKVRLLNDKQEYEI